jgi:4-amino-4-deoxy-L-arabinose transferase-like glycosyltransferase
MIAAAISVINSRWPEPARPRFDEKYYYRVAEGIAAGGSYEDGYVVRAPLYPLFLGGVFKVFGVSLTTALVIQALLRGLVVAGVALMGREYVSKKAGLIGAAILVVYPELIQTYTRLMTEVTYIPLFLLSFYLVEKMAKTEAVNDSIRAGIACGAASLARSTSVFFTLLVAVWLVLSASGSGRFSRAKLACAALLVLMLVVTVSPWTIRNLVVHGGFIAVSNDAAFNLWLVASGQRIKDVTAEWQTWGTQAERQREAYRRWFNHLRQDPGLHLRRLASGLPRLVHPEWGARIPQTAPRVRDAKPDAAEIYRRVRAALRPTTYLLLLFGGLAGVIVVERSPTRRNLLLLTFFYFLVVHSATLSRIRFMVPLNVLLAVYSGGLLARLASLRRTPAG